MSLESNQKYLKQIDVSGQNYKIYDIRKAAADTGFDIQKLPYSLRVLFENTLRSNPEPSILASFKNWLNDRTSSDEIQYKPARVLMQDFTGVPAIVDLASMRDAMKKLNKNPQKINPLIPVDLVVDHSVQVDSSGSSKSFVVNVKKEVERNKERYELLKWGQNNFNNFRVVPPGTGICHQVNLEYLAKVIWMQKQQDGSTLLYPDTLVGTDSHTTMINGISVLGWGVGGIEAEAAMLGQPIPMILPEVIGVKLTGSLQGNITATDLVLTVTQMLRKKGVVGKFVEFFGSGLDNLTIADRATISNMAPEYGATCGFFPIDEETIKYLKLTGRDNDLLEIVEEYAKTQDLWRSDASPEYTDLLELDISSLEPTIAGPNRPQDRAKLSDIKSNFVSLLSDKTEIEKKYAIDNKNYKIGHGDIAIAAITSCTNTSNPSVMIAAGLMAKRAVELGIKPKPWVKTSLAPGSKVVTEYLDKSGLTKYLDAIGFNLVGYGCTTCIGNSGPLGKEIDKVVAENNLTVAAILSGNRNFEGRIHPRVKASYLASPPLVVAYALAGNITIDLGKEVIAKDKDGNNIYLNDIWPTHLEIQQHIEKYVAPEMFAKKYRDVFEGDENWLNLQAGNNNTYKWDSGSTYINNPPYFDDIHQPVKSIENIKDARIIALFGDSITTDHISPAGAISANSPAAKFLINKGVSVADFNSYGSRRGNHEVMMRGSFANIRIKNQICPEIEGGFTKHYPDNRQMSIYDAAMEYKAEAVPLVIFAGKEYGTGSSRDWAAKGTKLLGIRAVIAGSFERIHRSNLIGMGVLPITFDKDISWQDLNLQGNEKISILNLSDNIQPYEKLKCHIIYEDGNNETIDVILQVHTENEIEYIKNGGILRAVIRNLS